jgi:transposase
MIGCRSCSSRCSRRGHQRAGRVGRPPIEDRAAPGGILFMLNTGCRWPDLPSQLGVGSGRTASRRLRAWQAAGVWDRLQQRVLDELAPSRCEQVLPRLLEVGICRNHSTRKLPRRVASSSWLLPARSVRMTTVSRTPFSTITDSARDHRAVPRLVRRSVEGYPGYQPGRPRANRALHVRKSTE